MVTRTKAKPVEEAPAPRRTRTSRTAPVEVEVKTRTTRTASTAVTKRKSTLAEINAPVAKRRSSKTDVAEATTLKAVFDPYHNIDSIIDGIEKKNGVSDSGLNKNEKRLSTGVLVLDLVLGGGIVGGGWYTIYGHEQVGKSTLITTLMTAGLNTGVPIQQSWDYEGSTEPNYVENIIKTQGVKGNVENIFGIKDTEGKWAVKPKVRLYRENVAEKFFDSTASLLRRLPEKTMIGEDWFYIYDNDKAGNNKKLVGNLYDKEYFKRTAKFKVPAPDGNPQALLYVDSYPAMLPEGQDVEDPGSAMASQARMFSEQLKRVKGKMRNRKVTVIGVNSLRLKPGVSFGNPEYEPCGQAIRLYSDVRLHLASLALNSVPGVSGKGQIEEEDSVEGRGNDTYRYVRVRATKNKLSTPFLEGWLRIWITDRKGQGRGYCPTWDVFQYLLMTGQATGSRGRMKVVLAKGETFSCNWLQLKRLCSSDLKTVKEACDELKIKPIKIRDFCFKQLKAGTGFEMFFAAKAGALEEKAGAKAKGSDEHVMGEEDDEEDEDEDDE